MLKSRGTTGTLAWLPDRMGIAENEKADQLARNATVSSDVAMTFNLLSKSEFHVYAP